MGRYSGETVIKVQGIVGFELLDRMGAFKSDNDTDITYDAKKAYKVVLKINKKYAKELLKEYEKAKKEAGIRGSLPKKDTAVWKGEDDPKMDDTPHTKAIFMEAKNKKPFWAGYVKHGKKIEVEIGDRESLFASGTEVIAYITLWSPKDYDTIGANLLALQYIGKGEDPWASVAPRINMDDIDMQEADIDDDVDMDTKPKKDKKDKKSKKDKKDKKDKKPKKDKNSY